MNRIDMSDRLFRLAWDVKRAPATIRIWAATTAHRVAYAAGEAVKALGAAVRGCGCTDDDPECCERRSVTDPTYRSWCRCDCHDGNTAAKAAQTMAAE